MLEYYQYKIAINIFYDRASFLYVGAASKYENIKFKWFNDVPRAMQK